MFGWLHHVGIALLLLSAILMLITTITAPVSRDLAIMKVMLTNHTDIRPSSVVFGSFGHCILDVPPIKTDQDYCFPRVIGYDPIRIMREIDGRTFDDDDVSHVNSLTHGFILHPLAVAFIILAAIASLGGVSCRMVGIVTAVVAWLISLTAMSIDFVVFKAVKWRVNQDQSGSRAEFSSGMWTCVSGMLILFLGTVILFFTCCTKRN